MNFVMILAPGFEELEAIGTADVLTRLGAKVTMAGLNSMNIQTGQILQHACPFVF